MCFCNWLGYIRPSLVTMFHRILDLFIAVQYLTLPKKVVMFYLCFLFVNSYQRILRIFWKGRAWSKEQSIRFRWRSASRSGFRVPGSVSVLKDILFAIAISIDGQEWNIKILGGRLNTLSAFIVGYVARMWKWLVTSALELQRLLTFDRVMDGHRGRL